jgi:AraC family transcriptional regulator of adaptative response/methylated-DNA-[protein]-cysteine methyltransferase
MAPVPALTDSLWDAVLDRRAAADGAFVYAVTSTRVYCRPSCPSRRPRRDRVQFFPAPEMAAAAGYRPCRRCHPDRTSGPMTSPADRVRRVCRAVAARPDARWTSARLATAGRSSVTQVQRAFRAALGLSPRDYVAACRRRTFLQELRKGAAVTNAVYTAGFGSSSRMYDAIRLPGMRPATYGRGGRGASIEWTTTESPVGRILVAATTTGLCFVEVGEATDVLVESLRAEFPQATIATGPSTGLRPMAEAAARIADGAMRWTTWAPAPCPKRT